MITKLVAHSKLTSSMLHTILLHALLSYKDTFYRDMASLHALEVIYYNYLQIVLVQCNVFLNKSYLIFLSMMQTEFPKRMTPVHALLVRLMTN